MPPLHWINQLEKIQHQDQDRVKASIEVRRKLIVMYMLIHTNINMVIIYIIRQGNIFKLTKRRIVKMRNVISRKHSVDVIGQVVM